LLLFTCPALSAHRFFRIAKNFPWGRAKMQLKCGQNHNALHMHGHRHTNLIEISCTIFGLSQRRKTHKKYVYKTSSYNCSGGKKKRMGFGHG